MLELIPKELSQASRREEQGFYEFISKKQVVQKHNECWAKSWVENVLWGSGFTLMAIKRRYMKSRIWILFRMKVEWVCSAAFSKHTIMGLAYKYMHQCISSEEICISFCAKYECDVAPTDFYTIGPVLRYQAERFQKHFGDLNCYGSLGCWGMNKIYAKLWYFWVRAKTFLIVVSCRRNVFFFFLVCERLSKD